MKLLSILWFVLRLNVVSSELPAFNEPLLFFGRGGGGSSPGMRRSQQENLRTLEPTETTNMFS